MNFIQYLEDIEKATGSKQKLKIIETELRPPNTNFEEFLRITFNDTVLNISDKIIESSLGMTYLIVFLIVVNFGVYIFLVFPLFQSV